MRRADVRSRKRTGRVGAAISSFDVSFDSLASGLTSSRRSPDSSLILEQKFGVRVIGNYLRPLLHKASLKRLKVKTRWFGGQSSRMRNGTTESRKLESLARPAARLALETRLRSETRLIKISLRCTTRVTSAVVKRSPRGSKKVERRWNRGKLGRLCRLLIGRFAFHTRACKPKHSDRNASEQSANRSSYLASSHFKIHSSDKRFHAARRVFTSCTTFCLGITITITLASIRR